MPPVHARRARAPTVGPNRRGRGASEPAAPAAPPPSPPPARTRRDGRGPSVHGAIGRRGARSTSRSESLDGLPSKQACTSFKPPARTQLGEFEGRLVGPAEAPAPAMVKHEERGR